MASKAGYIVTLIGGITQLLAALSFLAGGSLLAFILPGFMKAIAFVPVVWFLIAGVLSIWASTMMNKNDAALIKKGGIIALITGILAPNLIVLIGAIIALVHSE